MNVPEFLFAILWATGGYVLMEKYKRRVGGWFYAYLIYTGITIVAVIGYEFLK